YMNWAEYISWRNPRISSFAQYPIYDPFRPLASNGYGGFASGLLSWNGVPKATYSAWRLPLYLPVTSARPGQALQVWGCVRPALYGAHDTGAAQTAQIQFAPGSSGGGGSSAGGGSSGGSGSSAAGGSSGAFTTIQTVTLGSSSTCYFHARVRFSASGTVRLSFGYPPADSLLAAAGDQVVSRSVQVTVRK
ncbi:MAG: hypothetical protein ACRDPA_28765, partial [Solirubrobacteraceae bacterium]